MKGRDDRLVRVKPVLERFGAFRKYPGGGDEDAPEYKMLRQAQTIGRPLGNADWMASLEAQTGRKFIA